MVGGMPSLTQPVLAPKNTACWVGVRHPQGPLPVAPKWEPWGEQSPGCRGLTSSGKVRQCVEGEQGSWVGSAVKCDPNTLVRTHIPSPGSRSSIHLHPGEDRSGLIFLVSLGSWQRAQLWAPSWGGGSKAVRLSWPASPVQVRCCQTCKSRPHLTAPSFMLMPLWSTLGCG